MKTRKLLEKSLLQVFLRKRENWDIVLLVWQKNHSKKVKPSPLRKSLEIARKIQITPTFRNLQSHPQNKGVDMTLWGASRWSPLTLRTAILEITIKWRGIYFREKKMSRTTRWSEKVESPRNSKKWQRSVWSQSFLSVSWWLHSCSLSSSSTISA